MSLASDLHALRLGGLGARVKMEAPVKSKVLLVDDDESNREMLARRLQHRGYDVVTAIDGQEALARASAESPSLILMDVSLPVIDGLTVTRQLKSSAALRDIPVIALTGHASLEDRDQARAAGCDDFDTKPIEFTRLEKKMEALLRQTAARSV